MIFLLILLLIANVTTLHAMENDTNFSHNTYYGTEITPLSLLDIAPQMPHTLRKQTDEWLEEYEDLVTQLVTTPHPLTHKSRQKKTVENFALIDSYEQQNKVKNLSEFNYVLKFNEHNNFTVPINRWGSRVAYWVYATDQGSILDPKFKQDFDCSQFEYMPSYQHCSRVAHYLRLKEVIEKEEFKYLKTTPTYLKHIPTKPEILSDENYVVIQEWVDNLKELKQLPEQEQLEIRKNIPAPALEEMHKGIVYAALWDLRGNMAFNPVDSSYYMVDLEEPFNHKPQFFFYQGTEGKHKYIEDIVDGLERMAYKLQNEPEQLNRWKRLTDNNLEFKQVCDEFKIYPNYDANYLESLEQ